MNQAASGGGADALAGPVVLRMETLRGNQVTGVLELAPPQVRWTPRLGPDAAAGLTIRPDAAQLENLLAAARQLLAR